MVKVPDRYSKCSRQHINLWQTTEERREKYDYCRAMGLSSYMATRMRDWRMEYILHYFIMVDAHDRLVLERIEKEGTEGDKENKNR